MTRAPNIEVGDGVFFDISDVKPEMVCVEDIATSLANTCRWRGHIIDGKYYSVAEHAVRVMHLMEERGFSGEYTHAGLHHDSHEAYVGDTPTPFKPVLLRPRYEFIVAKIDAAIGIAVGTNDFLFHSVPVKQADADMLMVEADQLKASKGVGDHYGLPPKSRPDMVLGWQPDYARRMFLRAHHTGRSGLCD